MKKEAIKNAEKLIGRGDTDKSSPEPILVMTTNQGHVGLLLNFFCSLRAAGLPTPKHFVVTPTKEMRDMLDAAGITAFWHAAVGNIPDKPSESCVNLTHCCASGPFLSHVTFTFEFLDGEFLAVMPF